MSTAARQSRPVLIAGGGIGGLAAALALAKMGIKCRVLERRPAFSEAGAGIQIGPNGVAALRWLGAAAKLEPHAGKPEEVRVYDGRTGHTLTALPLGAAIEARMGAPYWTAHRADLHAALLESAELHPLIVIQTDFQATRLEATFDGVRLLALDGTQATGAGLIGADGLWSKIRSYVSGRIDLRFAGWRAYRAVVPMTDAPAALQANATGLWLAPRAHIVHYPVRGTSEIALVVIVPETQSGEGWNLSADRDMLLGAVRHLAPAIQELLTVASGWRSWSLFETPPLARWTNGRVTLLGDAAHPVLPFLAQGGVLAIEDAVTLAQCLANPAVDIPAAFETYAQTRKARAGRVATASKRNGGIYHMTGPAAFARNLVMRATPPPTLIGQYDWLYSWKPGPSA